jgi:hypothetical protein
MKITDCHPRPHRRTGALGCERPCTPAQSSWPTCSGCFDFVEKLNEVDTTGVEPLIFMTEEQDVLREDDAAVPGDVVTKAGSSAQHAP